MLDLDYVRGQFPTLSAHPDWSFMDNAGGSLPLRGVIDGVADCLARWPVQLGASYEVSAEATRRFAEAHATMEAWIGAAPGSVVLGPSTTRNLHMLAAALRPLWREGDEVIVTNLDHEANIGPWRRLAATGIVVREWRVHPESARLELDDLDALLSERTRLVALTHCSNIVGEIVDIAEVARRVHQAGPSGDGVSEDGVMAGAKVCVDGVAYAPHRCLDVTVWDVDFYAFSLYKTYGPHLALLYGKPELLRAARNQNHFFYEEDQVPGKFEPGNVSHELVAALPAIPHYFEQLASRHGLAGAGGADTLIRKHEAQLASRLLDFLTSRSNVRVLGPTTADPDVRVPTLAFLLEDAAGRARKSSDIPPLLDREHIAIRWGDFYARRLMQDLGLLEQDGVVRVSLVHYNTLDEVDRLVEVLERVL